MTGLAPDLDAVVPRELRFGVANSVDEALAGLDLDALLTTALNRVDLDRAVATLLGRLDLSGAAEQVVERLDLDRVVGAVLTRLDLDLADAAFGVPPEIPVDTAAVCSGCAGSGCAPGAHPTTCGTCRAM